MARSPRIREKALAWWDAQRDPGGRMRAHRPDLLPEDRLVRYYRQWRRANRNHGESYRYCGAAAPWCPLHTPYRQRTRRHRRH